MRTCFVPLCDDKNKDQPNRTMFLVPKDKHLFAQWETVLPKLRNLRCKDRICHLHFKPDEVINTFDHIINGKQYKFKRDRPRLKPQAVPCLEIPTKDELASYKVKIRLLNNSKVNKEPPIEQESFELVNIQEFPQNDELYLNNEIEKEPLEILSNEVLIDEEVEIQNLNDNLLTINDIDDQVAILPEENYNEYVTTTIPHHISTSQEDTINNLFNLIYDNVYEVLTPNSLWGVHRCPQRSIIYFSYMDITKMQITKMISMHCDGVIKLIASSRLIKMLNLVSDIDNMDNLSVLLHQVDNWDFCFGQDSNQECEVVVEPSDDNCWSTDENEQVFFLCKTCLPPS